MAPRSHIARHAVVTTTVALVAVGLSSAAPVWAAENPTDAPPAALRASALMAWHLAPSLEALRAEINATWPARDRTSDGSIGDARHQARANSHNPVGHTGGPAFGTRGSVHAVDITATGIDVDRVLRAVIGDSRVWYVIYGGQIWSRTTNWAPRTYAADPHTTHLHVNLREDSQSLAVAAEHNTSSWLSGSTGSGRGTSARTSRSVPTGQAGLTRTATTTLQKALIAKGYRIPSGATGWYGPETTAAVQAFQRAQGWSGSGADGIAGAQTLRLLGVTSGAAIGAATPTATSNPAAATSRTSTGTSAPSGTYRPGTASRAVYDLQQALIAHGYSIPAGATGYYGTRTVAAVRAFQRAQGWPEAQCDGIPGPQTLRRLGL